MSLTSSSSEENDFSSEARNIIAQSKHNSFSLEYEVSIVSFSPDGNYLRLEYQYMKIWWNSVINSV